MKRRLADELAEIVLLLILGVCGLIGSLECPVRGHDWSPPMDGLRGGTVRRCYRCRKEER